MHRREFLATLGSGAVLAPAALRAATAPAPQLGIDLFSLRSQGWNAFQFLDYAARFHVRTVHFSEIRFLGGLDDEHVKRVGAYAAGLGIELEIGMKSICPTASIFDARSGPAAEQLLRVARAAHLAGSKIVRAVLGTFDDRRRAVPGNDKEPIEAHIEGVIGVLRGVRSQIADMGLKVAIENHAGDMQARELKMLIEGAGPDFVGACFDSGNPCWVLEDPHVALETLAPYVVTSHIRDSYLWNTPEGTAVRWVRMGEGNIGMERLLTRFQQLCPAKAMSLEVIVTPPRIYPWRRPEFWNGYGTVRAAECARFLTLAEGGRPQPPEAPATSEGEAAVERANFEAAMKWTREFLRLA
jgi:sugar phosphate isomerase/epimerase